MFWNNITFKKQQFLFKGIVQPKIKIWCVSAYPKGIQDVSDFLQ